jgi:hypothetical protein
LKNFTFKVWARGSFRKEKKEEEKKTRWRLV